MDFKDLQEKEISLEALEKQVTEKSQGTERQPLIDPVPFGLALQYFVLFGAVFFVFFLNRRG